MKEIWKVELIRIKARISELDKAKGEGMSSTYYWNRRRDLIDKLNYWLKRYNIKGGQIDEVTERISTGLSED
jgi:hypothetical protein